MHLSIDLVFSGTRGGGHIETDETDPVTVYGKTMAEAERILLGGQKEDLEQKVTKETKGGEDKNEHGNQTVSCITTTSSSSSASLPSFPSVQNPFVPNPKPAILRISLPMGVSFNGHAGAIDWIQSRFKKQKPATLYYDEIRTPTYTDCLNPLLATLLARPSWRACFTPAGRGG